MKMKASRPRTRSGAGLAAGFTLLEVLAGVLILGILYTVLATAAIRGLQSEGRDRRRAEASLLADRELAELESAIAVGALLEDGTQEREEPPYRITVEVVPEDVMALLPEEVRQSDALGKPGELATLLVNDQGESRVQRLSVTVSWEEGFDTDSIARTTYGFDKTGLEDLLPAEDGGTGTGDETGASGDDGLTERERMIRQFEQELGLGNP
jgi:prepilin-type N-terminal cleavage/methylation domain-containing protein